MRLLLGILAFVILALAGVSVYVIWFSPDKRRPDIVFQLQWFDQAQFAGFYVAEENGIYRKEGGLDVAIQPGSFAINPILVLDSGVADIALATADQVLISRALGKKIKAVGVVFSKSLVCFMSYKDDHINSVDMFKGRIVGVYQNFDSDNVLRVLLRRHNVSVDEVDIRPAGSLVAFEKHEFDIWPSYRINEPLTMRRRGKQIDCLKPEDYGVRFYADTIIVRDETLAQRPAMVKEFLKDSREGWRRAKENPAQAIDAMYKLNLNIGRDPEERVHQHDMLEEAVKNVGDPTSGQLLNMDKSVWIEMATALQEIGKISRGIDVHQLVDEVVVAGP